jgi:hypothetical protein
MYMNYETNSFIEFVMTIKNNLKVELELDHIELVTDCAYVKHFNNKATLEP